MQQLIGDLNRLYTSTPSLYARDCEGEGFRWLIADDSANAVFAWARFSGEGHPIAVVIANFTPVLREGYRVPLPTAGRWTERINTDAGLYWGSGKGNAGVVVADASPAAGMPGSAFVTLPPMATLILEYAGP